jgi:hypothetical protein
MITHSLVLPWPMILTAIGLRRLLNVKRAAAWGLVSLSTLTTLPFLALFARWASPEKMDTRMSDNRV